MRRLRVLALMVAGLCVAFAANFASAAPAANKVCNSQVQSCLGPTHHLVQSCGAVNACKAPYVCLNCGAGGWCNNAGAFCCGKAICQSYQTCEPSAGGLYCKNK